MSLVLVLIHRDTQGWDREVTVSGKPCYLKALYYALYLWPQGSGQWRDMFNHMIYSRQHWRVTFAGHLAYRPLTEKTQFVILACFALRSLHIPTIGGIFF